jgi:hypothetical protein
MNNKTMKTILKLLVWYGIFCFITSQVNPMLWSVTVKVIAAIISLAIVNDDDN